MSKKSKHAEEKSVLNGMLFITHGSGVKGDRNFPLASIQTAVHARQEGWGEGADLQNCG